MTHAADGETVKHSPEELKNLRDDLDVLKEKHRPIISAEPNLEKLIDGAREYADRRYGQVSS